MERIAVGGRAEGDFLLWERIGDENLLYFTFTLLTGSYCAAQRASGVGYIIPPSLAF